jgi:L-threonylcarbamoyladenylate synthase
MDWKVLARARDLLNEGQVVAIPTETVYGLAARIDKESAVRAIFSSKERPFFDPLIVHVATFAQVDGLITAWPPLARELARRFWPGPLTVVLPKSERVSDLITSGLETVAIRMPAHPMARRLIRSVGVPLAAPSANKFGKTSPTEAQHVRSEFVGQNILVVDGGPCAVGLESTVIRVVGHEVEVLRPGSITHEMLAQALRQWPEPVQVQRVASESSPGHLEHHYMPQIPLVTMSEKNWPLTNQVRLRLQAQLAIRGDRAVLLKLSDEPAQAARELYKSLREASGQGDFIVAIRKDFHQGGYWTAIWDRLQRASFLHFE